MWSTLSVVVAGSCGKHRYSILPNSCLGSGDCFLGPTKSGDEGIMEFFLSS